jgi:hypothetical protein
MKQHTEATSGNVKPVILPGMDCKPTMPWGKSAKREDTPAPPPIWTRYIDSRLKQFCAR